MRVAITGAGGFIGNNLTGFFEKEGHQVVKVGRQMLFENREELSEKLEGANVIIHLSGAPILQRWTKRNREEIRNSRVISGKNIFKAIGAGQKMPEIVFLSSAVGIYSNDGKHDESSNNLDHGFLGELVKEWEETAHSIRELGIRTVIMRLGIVLGPDGGALKKLIIPFKLGMGAVIAGGEQMVPFIHVYDVYSAMKFMIEKSDYSGPVNFVTPFPVTNRMFSKSLATVMGKPCYFRIPDFIMMALYGNASVLVTKGQHVIPGVLNRLGYEFDYPFIENALENAVKV